MLFLFVLMITSQSFAQFRSADFKISEIENQEGAVLGKFKIFKEGTEITEKCQIIFKNVMGPSYQFDATGILLLKLESGLMSVHHLRCEKSNDTYLFSGVGFSLMPKASDTFVTYIGDVRIDLKEGNNRVFNIQVVDDYNRTVGPFHIEQGKAAQVKYAKKLLGTIRVPEYLKNNPKSNSAPTSNALLNSKAVGIDDNQQTEKIDFKKESSYFLVAAQYSIPKYEPSLIQDKYDSLKASGASSLPVGLELGYYFPWGSDQWMTGVGLNLIQHSSSTTTSSYSMLKMFLGLSNEYFVTGHIGKGLFLRADLGLSRFQQTISGSTDINFTNGTTATQLGFGYRLGGGLAMSLNPGTHLHAMLSYLSLQAKDGAGTTVSSKALEMSLGVLF